MCERKGTNAAAAGRTRAALGGSAWVMAARLTAQCDITAGLRSAAACAAPSRPRKGNLPFRRRTFNHTEVCGGGAVSTRSVERGRRRASGGAGCLGGNAR